MGIFSDPKPVKESAVKVAMVGSAREARLNPIQRACLSSNNNNDYKKPIEEVMLNLNI